MNHIVCLSLNPGICCPTPQTTSQEGCHSATQSLISCHSALLVFPDRQHLRRSRLLHGTLLAALYVLSPLFHLFPFRLYQSTNAPWRDDCLLTRLRSFLRNLEIPSHHFGPLRRPSERLIHSRPNIDRPTGRRHARLQRSSHLSFNRHPHCFPPLGFRHHASYCLHLLHPFWHYSGRIHGVLDGLCSGNQESFRASATKEREIGGGWAC